MDRRAASQASGRQARQAREGGTGTPVGNDAHELEVLARPDPGVQANKTGEEGEDGDEREVQIAQLSVAVEAVEDGRQEGAAYQDGNARVVEEQQEVADLPVSQQQVAHLLRASATHMLMLAYMVACMVAYAHALGGVDALLAPALHAQQASSS